MNSSDTLVYAKAMSAGKLRASLDRSGLALAARPGISYVADDHGLGLDVTHFALVRPDVLAEQPLIALAS